MFNQTRFPELTYHRAPKGWRFIDASTGKEVGPVYATRAELLADCERYARESWGLE